MAKKGRGDEERDKVVRITPVNLRERAVPTTRDRLIPRSVEEDEQYASMYPVWSFARVDVACPRYGWQLCQTDLLDHILDFMKEMEKTPWSALFQRKATYHTCPIDVKEFDPVARKRLEILDLDEDGTLSRFRLGSRQRIWGRATQKGVFEIVWWDPDHQVWPTDPHGT